MCGFTPDQVRAMSLAEAAAIIDGFAEFNGSGQKNPQMTREEYEQLKIEAAKTRQELGLA
jgi:hypothetical protein